MKSIKRSRLRHLLSAVLLLTVPMHAIATTAGDDGTGKKKSDGSTKNCAKAIFGGILAGALVDKKKGAVIGAAVGIAACIAIKAKSRRTKTASEVERDYTSTHGALPSEPSVVQYHNNISAGKTFRRDEPISIVSNIEVIAGSDQGIDEVKEEIKIYEPRDKGPHDKPFKTAEKVVPKSGTGGYENTFTVDLGKDTPQGVYRIETTLYLNGNPVDSKNSSVQLVIVETSPGQFMVAAR